MSKVLFNINIFLLAVAFFVIPPSNGQPVEAEEYIVDVAKRMVLWMETGTSTEKLLIALKDFEKDISVKEPGMEFSGKVLFHSGVISRIKAAQIMAQTISSAVDHKHSRIIAVFVLVDVQVVYDASLIMEPKSHTENATFLIRFDKVQFLIQIDRKHSTQKVLAAIYPAGVTQGYTISIEVHPDNGYTQMIGLELRTNMNFREPIQNSLDDWIKYWQTGLTHAVSEIGYPEVMYGRPFCESTIESSNMTK